MTLNEEMQAAGLAGPELNKKPRMPMAKKVETKRERFVRIAQPRVQRAIHGIAIVGLLGGPNKYRYEYYPSDIEAILAGLTEAVKEVGTKLRREAVQLKMFELPKAKNGGTD